MRTFVTESVVLRGMGSWSNAVATLNPVGNFFDEILEGLHVVRIVNRVLPIILRIPIERRTPNGQTRSVG